MKRKLVLVFALAFAALWFSHSVSLTQGQQSSSKSTSSTQTQRKKAKEKPKNKAKQQKQLVSPTAQAAQQLDQDEEDNRVEQQFLKQRLYPFDKLPQGAYDRAQEQWQQFGAAASEDFSLGVKTLERLAVSAVTGTVWTPIGPGTIAQGASLANGRVNAIAINPNNPNIIYQGASGGGVWKSTDAGAHWTPLLEQQPSMGIGQPSAIAIDPNNTDTIYVGTTEYAVLNISVGILKSTDGGGSWIRLGSGYPAGNTGNSEFLFSGQWITSIIVDPANSNVLYLSASNGLFRSNDGGQNWTGGTNGFGFAQSLAIDLTSPANARILYAGINNRGVFRSNNGGQTWTAMLTTATPAVNTALAGGTFNKVVVALAPPTATPNPAGIQVMYATMEGVPQGTPPSTTPDPLGIFQSTDQGVTWTRRTATGLGGCQCFFTLEMGVDPASPGDGVNDIIYWGGTGQSKSTDSGNTFSNIGNGQHVDTHSLWTFLRQPSGPSIVYTGNDGGIWRSKDGGTTWTGTGGPEASINSGGLQTALIYNMAVKNDATASVSIASTQDNGNIRTTGSVGWTSVEGGDGWDVEFDAVNTSTAYVSSGFWSPAPCTRIWRSVDDGVTWGQGPGTGVEITPWGTTTDQGCYLAPLKADPSNGGTLYASGSQNLWQTRDSGGTWRIIRNTGGTGQIAVAPANSNNVAFAIGRDVFVSTNALAATVGAPSGVTFTSITRNLPNRIVTRVAFDPSDPSVIYVVLSGFGTGHVFRTTITGTTWTDISPAVGSGAIFDVPFNALALDGGTSPTTIYAGTDLGVIRSVNGGTSWTALDDQHLPNVPVTELVLNSQAKVLRAATFGRGVFELKAASGPVIAVSVENGATFNACLGESTTANVQVYNVGTTSLHIDSVQRLFGSTDFSVLPFPSAPLDIGPNTSVNFTVKFTPTVTGTQTATIRVSSNDPASPFYDLTVTGTSEASAIATVIADSGNFGDVCVGKFKDLPLTINNSGGCELRITNITSSSPEFQTAGVLVYPLVIAPGSSLIVPIRFQPTSFGAKTANIRLSSNDPLRPVQTVPVSGNAPSATIVVNDPITFDKTCPGETNNKTLTIGNSGGCDLIVKSITSSSPEFKVVGVVPFPLVIPPGSTRDVTIQFMPMGFTVDPMRMATLTIMSNDLNTPNKNVKVIGIVPPPVIQAMPDPLDFGKVCLGKSKELPLTIKNTGECNLTVSGATFSSPEFKLASPPAFPFIVPPGGSRTVMVSFMPMGATGPRMATMTINSDDPATPMKIVTLKGEAPVSAIAISGPTDWGDVLVGKFRDQVITITNTEECDLAITLVCELKNVLPQQPSVEFNVVNPLNYPVIIPAGKSLSVTIRFKPEKKGPRAASLIVFGYDPQTSSLLLKNSVPLKGTGK